MQQPFASIPFSKIKTKSLTLLHKWDSSVETVITHLQFLFHIICWGFFQNQTGHFNVEQREYTSVILNWWKPSQKKRVKHAYFIIQKLKLDTYYPIFLIYHIDVWGFSLP